MSNLKKYLKYIIWIIAGYLFTNFLIFVGFNLNYKNMDLVGNLPDQISIEKAESTRSQGRIYGYVQNSEENNLNNKYIKITIYDSNNEKIETDILSINNLENDEKKLFKSIFRVNDAKSYEISIEEE